MPGFGEMLRMMQVPTPPTPPPPDLPVIVQSPPWEALPPQAVVMIVLAVCALSAIVLYPLMRALARRIEGRGTDAALHAEVDELRTRVQELESAQHQVAELEERLDFAERLLAQQRTPERLPNS